MTLTYQCHPILISSYVHTAWQWLSLVCSPRSKITCAISMLQSLAPHTYHTSSLVMFAEHHPLAYYPIPKHSFGHEAPQLALLCVILHCHFLLNHLLIPRLRSRYENQALLLAHEFPWTWQASTTVIPPGLLFGMRSLHWLLLESSPTTKSTHAKSLDLAVDTPCTRFSIRASKNLANRLSVIVLDLASILSTWPCISWWIFLGPSLFVPTPPFKV